MKRVFRAVPFIVLALILGVISCQHDDATLQNEQVEGQASQFTIKMESGDHLREINPTVYQRLSETSHHTSSLSQTENGINMSSFTLDLSTIQIIERNTYTQYTTSVFDHTEYETYLINYLLLDFNDGAQYQFLIKYPRIFTNEGIALDRLNAVMERIEGDVLFQTETGGSRPCLDGVPEIVDTAQEYQCTEFNCTGGNHTVGEECDCGTPGYSCIPAYEVCGWVTVNVWGCSVGGVSGTGTSTPTGGNSNDPNDPDDNDDELIETVPMLSAPEEIEICMNFGNLGSSLPLSDTQIDWLQTIGKQSSAINEYLKSANCDLEAKVFILEAIETMILENISFEEFILRKVEDLLEGDPLALLEIDCDQIQHWQALAQHTAPQSVQDKINGLDSSITNDFYIQSLDDAGGTALNMDYFGVKVTTLPMKPNSNPATRYTADEYLDYIRRNFNDFVDGSTFEPYCVIQTMCQTETDLWASSNPIGSIIYIDIPGDDGVVVCTEYTNSYWYFMTMNSPYAGNHPVSGTRQFGYETNTDGSYNFFVRGADRFNNGAIFSVVNFFSSNPFSGADDLWESFQTKLKEHVNSNFGSSVEIEPIKNRPDWEKVKKVLKGELPISKLGCN